MRIKIILLFLLGAVWIFPITRWSHTMSQVMKTDAEEQSINSNDDVRWNVMVGSFYLIAAVATIVECKRPGTFVSVSVAPGAAAGITAGRPCPPIDTDRKSVV